ncbi:hypothetical protein B0H17DRAFT_1051034 [Mycena rosella]|uniref:Uncharacterized protein n=1 Tax=Mycena rosella TaxID=1033263 RepID=A0AAD7DSK3_MYCRO|nr:hypothetical protein B0H17DRAFT_1051034 [Mycena rosella]
MLSYISTSSDSSSPSPSVNLSSAEPRFPAKPSQTDASPRVSPIPGLQADLRATGVHSTPWSQSQHANPYTLHLSPMSTRPNTPSVSDSQRTTDPRQRAKVNATQSTPVTPTRTQSHSSFDQNATPTTTTTTHITQISSTVTKSPPKRPRASTVNKTPSNAGGRRPDAPEGARLGSEYRKRNISLRAMPLRSSPRRHTPVSIEDGELPTGDLEGAEQRAGRPDYSSAESS